MHRIALACLAAALLCATASASEVFMTRDAQGRPVYTDRPESLPAQKLNVATQQTDVVEAQTRYQQEMARYQQADKAAAEAARKSADTRQAAELSAADKAKRCQDARQRYQNLMNARRIYEPGSTPEERRYLDSAEIDATRADAKKVMDEFCAGQ
ncbi:MAG TPA: DUF4124 domain-containing protein [Steroidobacteraceae bacterium]|nr:DUF4124 domain-containing protein [Steroidobacteraceae bacterium]